MKNAKLQFKSDLSRKAVPSGIVQVDYLTREECLAYMATITDIVIKDVQGGVRCVMKGFLGQNTFWSPDTVLKYLRDVEHDVKLVLARIYQLSNPPVVASDYAALEVKTVAAVIGAPAGVLPAHVEKVLSEIEGKNQIPEEDLDDDFDDLDELDACEPLDENFYGEDEDEELDEGPPSPPDDYDESKNDAR